ncbi:putative mediator of RNA polymerase II transcription subunit 26 [Hydractinia symbiolongicarpus]|uniref:putative mediator of RNA polymerase II transcription subunit 26 n=1 Tax=Hydractinia symbiolongicarpus TaxID=13093 RepID=UPI00254CECF6|nr:putative mediator of RNA polymerase II transcription subunit 26 [Hydractinia symbiolongicarpus]
MKNVKYFWAFLVLPLINCALQEGVTEFYDADGSPVHMIVSGSVLVTDEPHRSSRSRIPHTPERTRPKNSEDIQRVTLSQENASKRHLHKHHKKHLPLKKDDIDEPTIIIVNKRDRDRVNRHHHHHHHGHVSVISAVRDTIPKKAVRPIKKTLYPPPSNLWQINEQLAETEEKLKASGKLYGFVNPKDQITFDAPDELSFAEDNLHPEIETPDDSSKFRTKETVPKAIPGTNENSKILKVPSYMSMRSSRLISHENPKNLNIDPASPDIKIVDSTATERDKQFEPRIENEKHIEAPKTENDVIVAASNTESEKHEQAQNDSPHETPRPHYSEEKEQEAPHAVEQSPEEQQQSPLPQEKEKEFKQFKEQQNVEPPKKETRLQQNKEQPQANIEQLQAPAESQQPSKSSAEVESSDVKMKETFDKKPLKIIDSPKNKANDKLQTESAEKQSQKIALTNYMQALNNKMKEIKKLKNASEVLLNVPKPVPHSQENLEDEKSYANSFQEKFLKLYSPAQLEDAKAREQQKHAQDQGFIEKEKPELKKDQSSVKDGGVLFLGNEPASTFRPHVKALVVQTKLNSVNFDDKEAKAKEAETKSQQSISKNQGTSEVQPHVMQQQPTRKIPENEVENPAGFASSQPDQEGKIELQPAYLASFKQHLAKNIQSKLGKLVQADEQKANQGMNRQEQGEENAAAQESNKEEVTETEKENLEKQAMLIKSQMKEKLKAQAQNSRKNKENQEDEYEEQKLSKGKAQQKHHLNVVYPSPNFNEFHYAAQNLAKNQPDEDENNNLVRFNDNRNASPLEAIPPQESPHVPELVKLTQKLKLNADDDVPDVVDNQNEKLVSARKNPENDQITITADPAPEGEQKAHHFQKPAALTHEAVQNVQSTSQLEPSAEELTVTQGKPEPLVAKPSETLAEEASIPQEKPKPLFAKPIKPKTFLLADPNVKLPLKQADINRIKAAQYILNKNRNAIKMLNEPVQFQVPVDVPSQDENGKQQIQASSLQSPPNPELIEAATNHQQNVLSDAKDQKEKPNESLEDLSNIDATAAVKIMSNQQPAELTSEEPSITTKPLYDKAQAPPHPDPKEKTVFGEKIAKAPEVSNANAASFKTQLGNNDQFDDMPAGVNQHAPLSADISRAPFVNAQSPQISTEPDVWPAGVNPGALLSFQMSNQDRITPEKGNLRGKIHTTADNLKGLRINPQRYNPKVLRNIYPQQNLNKIKQVPIKQNSVMSLIKPRIPTGPSIAYNQMLPPVVRGVYSSSKSKSQAKASSSSSSSASSNTNAAVQNGNKANTKAQTGATARHHEKKPGPNYGYGSGSGYGYGKTSYGWGGGGGWAGQPPPKGMPLPGYPSNVPAQIPGYPDAGSIGKYPGQGSAASQPSQQQPMNQNHQSSVAVGPASSPPGFANIKQPVKTKQNKLNEKMNKPAIADKPKKVGKTTSVKIMKQKTKTMKKIQKQNKFEKLKTSKQMRPNLLPMAESKPQHRMGGPKSVLPDEYDK